MEVNGCGVGLVMALSGVSGNVGGTVESRVGFTPENGMLGKLELKCTGGRVGLVRDAEGKSKE